MNLRRAACVPAFLAVWLSGAPLAAQTDNPELEGNDTKATATNAFSGGPGMVPGDTLSGITVSASGSGLDYFLVRTATLPPGIYRHQLVLTSATGGHTTTIRGLNVAAAPADTLPGIPWDGVVGVPGMLDATFQTGQIMGASRLNAWYGTGRGEQIYYRVAGTASTTASYVVTLQSSSVNIVPLGTFVEGVIRFNFAGQGHTSDTDVWLYDSFLNPIAGAGNDDANAALGGAPANAAQSFLARHLSPGTYYIAASSFNLANNLPSPSDDNFRTGTVLDFPDVVANSVSTAGTNITFTASDDFGNVAQAPSVKGTFGVNWFQIQVLPLGSPTNPAGVGSANPTSAQPGDNVTFTVSVTPGTNPPSTNLAVLLDATSIDAGVLPLFDNGVPPDAQANDSIFTAAAIIGPATAIGPQSLPFEISDGEGRSGNGNISITTFAPPTPAFDFGDMSLPNCQALTFDSLAGQTTWFVFNLSSPISAGMGTFLDIDTELSASCQDTEIGLYRADGTLVASDDDDGSGGVGVSQLTFGAGIRPPSSLCGSGGGPYNGRDGDLAPGTYYLAAGRFNMAFNPTAFSITNTGPAGTGMSITLCSRPRVELAGSGEAMPNPVVEGNAVALRVAVTPAELPASTGIAVTVDATPISGGLVNLLDNGVFPDLVAGDNVFSAGVIAAPPMPGPQSLAFSVTDAQSRSAAGSINFFVQGSPLGACCADDNTCSVISAFACASSGGAFAGPGTNCMSNPCVNFCGGGPKLFEQIDFGQLTGQLVSQSTNNCPGCLLIVSSWSCIDDFEINGLEGAGAPPVLVARVEALVRNTGPNEPSHWRVNIYPTRQAAEMLVFGNQYAEQFVVPTCRIPNYSPNFPGFELVTFDLGTGFGQTGSRELLPGQYWLGVVAVTSGDQPDVLVALSNLNDGADGPDAFQARYFPAQAPVQTLQNAAYRIRGVDPGPDCVADFNMDGNLDPDDLGDFINCFFSMPPCGQADFNHDGNVDPDDLGDFINAFFAGCG
ncbi:MAG: hypothetical protein AB7K52_02360 [Phycisphaerales bacterium]